MLMRAVDRGVHADRPIDQICICRGGEHRRHDPTRPSGPSLL